MRIKSSRDDDQIRLELTTHLGQGSFKCAFLVRSRSSGAQREIQSVTKAAAHALLASRPGSRIPGILVRRKKEDGWIVVKNSLCAIAMMYIPIDNRHVLNLGVVPLSITGCDG